MLARVFINASTAEPKPWQVALDFISYRTILNITDKPDTPIVSLPPNTRWKYVTLHVAGKPTPALSFSHASLAESQAAHLDPIGQDENKDIDSAPIWLFMTGGATGTRLLLIAGVSYYIGWALGLFGVVVNFGLGRRIYPLDE